MELIKVRATGVIFAVPGVLLAEMTMPREHLMSSEGTLAVQASTGATHRWIDQ